MTAGGGSRIRDLNSFLDDIEQEGKRPPKGSPYYSVWRRLHPDASEDEPGKKTEFKAPAKDKKEPTFKVISKPDVLELDEDEELDEDLPVVEVVKPKSADLKPLEMELVEDEPVVFDIASEDELAANEAEEELSQMICDVQPVFTTFQDTELKVPEAMETFKSAIDAYSEKDFDKASNLLKESVEGLITDAIIESQKMMGQIKEGGKDTANLEKHFMAAGRLFKDNNYQQAADHLKYILAVGKKTIAEMEEEDEEELVVAVVEDDDDDDDDVVVAVVTDDDDEIEEAKVEVIKKPPKKKGGKKKGGKKKAPKKLAPKKLGDKPKKKGPKKFKEVTETPSPEPEPVKEEPKPEPEQVKEEPKPEPKPVKKAPKPAHKEEPMGLMDDSESELSDAPKKFAVLDSSKDAAPKKKKPMKKRKKLAVKKKAAPGKKPPVKKPPVRKPAVKKPAAGGDDDQKKAAMDAAIELQNTLDIHKNAGKDVSAQEKGMVQVMTMIKEGQYDQAKSVADYCLEMLNK